MRTMVNLPEDVLQMARSLATQKGISLDQALTELVRAGLRTATGVNAETTFPSFRVSKHAKPITLAHTLRAEDEL
jgi:argininosuccinate lyase